MVNDLLSNKDILYESIYKKKVNLLSEFKTKNKIFLNNVKYIDFVKSLGCNISEASMWLTDNFLYINNWSINLLESGYFKKIKFNCIKSNNSYVPRIYLFCDNFCNNLKNIIEEDKFFSELNLYESKCRLDLEELNSVSFFLNYVFLERIYGLVDEIRKIEEDCYKGYKLFNNIIKYIKNEKYNLISNKLSYLLKNKVSLYTVDYFIKLVEENRIDNNIINKFLSDLLNNEKLTYDKFVEKNSDNLKEIRIKISMYIQSLKNLFNFNWKFHLENVSSVHNEFMKDPSGVYPNMDYESRNHYRSTLNRICKINKLNEYEEAVNIVKLSLNGNTGYSRHIGYYLIDEGVYRFKNIKRKHISTKINYFLCIISLIIFSEAFILYSLNYVFENKYLLITFSFFVLLIISDIWINFINYIFLEKTDRKFVPKMDYSKEIPDSSKTMIVIPSLLISQQEVESLVKNLELAYICNRNDNLYFALLLDYTDTISYDKSEDSILLEHVNKLVEDLNNKYKFNTKKFYVFIRDKVYNKSSKVYMGWERKRGKIMEFIKFLKGKESNYKINILDYEELKNIRYIISIDSDTKIIRDSAFKLIGAIDHVLNKAVVKNINNKNKVVRGYGIIQPKVSISFKSSLNTIYSKLFCGNTETPSYNLTISNIYHDIFSESIFIGKGIIDIDVFDKIMWDVIPEDRILSHDLIEGCFSRVSFSSDIEFQECFPSNILSNFMRLHRWNRGDLQLIPYLINGRGINFISKYKILDNLRRSLLPISYLILIIGLLFIGVRYRDIYYGVLALGIIFPFILNISSINLNKVSKDRLIFSINELKDRLIQSFVMFSFIPYHAYITFDAIVRVFVRLVFTKKNLLEWKTFSEVEKESSNLLINYLISMFPGLIFGGLFLTLSIYYKLHEMILLSVMFILSPFIAYGLSQKYRVVRARVDSKQNIFLRSLSRSIFAYFEDFVNDSTNYLVCDNYQEDPFIGIAKKTSPTNIGMSLTSFISGRDFGFITFIDMVEKLKHILDSIDMLPTHRGHLYNWYDIENNTSICNRYISTVDSGNLLASYYLARQSLQDMMNKPIIHSDLIKTFEELAYLSSSSSKDHLYKEIISYGFMCTDYISYIEFLKGILNESNKNITNLSQSGEDVYWHIKINETSNSFLNEILGLTCNINEIDNFKANKFGQLFIDVNLNELEKRILEYKTNYNNSSVRNELVDIKISGILYNIRKLIDNVYSLIHRLSDKINLMDFKFLYKEGKNLLSIGYDCENDKLDENCYDLLASEVRIASFLGIAKGDLPIEHWFKLGRNGIEQNGIKTLLSWTGTMFEYLMPMLYMKQYPGTMFFDTYRGCVLSQIKYANLNKIPFGISESCFYELDSELNYQYRAFGVPDLSIKKDFDNLVVSPYSSIMSLMVDYIGSSKNLNYLCKLGALGRYGFYEAIDFTKSRMKNGDRYAIVKNYMAHHQGMSLMALSNILINDVFQDRFEEIMDVKSVEELLTESSLNICVKKYKEEFNFINSIDSLENDFIPRVVKYRKNNLYDMQIYSNRDYSICMSSSGGGYLKYKDKYISKLSKDFTNENSWGSIYIKDLDNNELFSNTYLPCKNDNLDYICEFDFNKIKFTCKNKSINVTSEISVSKDENIEVRKIILKNLTSQRKNIEITSYFESDIINSSIDYINNKNICICGNEKGNLFMGHSIYAGGDILDRIEFEGRKESFIGRNGTIQYPISMNVGSSYGNYISNGSDSIMSLRAKIELEPYDHLSVYFLNSINESKEELYNTIEKYKNMGIINGLLKSNGYNLKSMISNLNITLIELSLFNYMTSSMIYGVNNDDRIINNRFNINDLISHNVNPNIPILSIEINSFKDLNNLEILIKAFSYFSINRLDVNLIILNSYISYDKNIDNEIDKIILRYDLKNKMNVDNGIYIILSSLYKNACDIVKSISNLHIVPGGDSVYDQIGFKIKDFRENLKEDKSNRLIEIDNDRSDASYSYIPIPYNKYLFEISDEITNYDNIIKYDIAKNDLKFYNSYGGFDLNNFEYILKLNDTNITPNYYRNILSNKHIFTIISSKGFVNTWAFECKEFLITEELGKDNYNYKGECIYIKDGNVVWSPTLNPISNGEDYIIYNSFNYTKIRNKYNDLQTEVKYFIPDNKKYKIIRINFKNLSSRDKSLSVCYFAPLLLSSNNDYSKNLYTYIDFDLKYIYGQNSLSRYFSNIKSYLKLFGCDNVSFTGSKREFLGINKGYFNPVGMYKDKLSNLSGIFLESCLCISGDLKLKANEEKNVYAILGYDDNIENINYEINEFIKNPTLFDDMNDENEKLFKNQCKIFKINTQDAFIDILINGWVLHQNDNEKFLLNSSNKGELNSCVDLMEKCLIYNYLDPQKSKKNIIKVFSNMYEDGRFRDKWSYLSKEYEINSNPYDLLSLVYLVSDYIKVTRDIELLKMDIKFVNSIENKNLEIKSSTIYDKCLKVINRYTEFRTLIGKDITETSVLFMLYKTLDAFFDVAMCMHDENVKSVIIRSKEDLLEFLSNKCFNGEFYINKLNVNENKKICNDIHLLPQVLSLGIVHETVNKVIGSIEKYLVNDELGFIREYFDKTTNIVREFDSIQNNKTLLLFIRELFKLNLNDRAYKYMSFLNPILRTISRNDVNSYKSEPYFIPYKLLFRGNNLFKVINEDFNYISSIFYRVVIEDILGINLRENGFYIKPHIPSSWDDYRVECNLFNENFEIIVKKGHNKCLKIDGENYEDDFIIIKNMKTIDLTI
ncbi:glucoamylase family protein [Candidatus Arthromitus sp. SFB-rat-Yit]|uniref:glucoamylase family protein n=1 Tax=Candidatus Arthromitus sp. SFB-rat-Yit TaxID=1041504 RepID=UPI000227A779|nr:glucoamylase family protein [Candidatus Arthromitus sp. SFB-rat-Yit]BAK81733.1 cyclic beta 1-2 glucan synthetase [Candidatus Arthromitus sp. SFB-rat-Yit]